MMRYILIFFACLMFLFGSCYYESGEELYFGDVCDTTNVTYTEVIQPLIANNCLACHASGNPNIFVTYEQVYDNAERIYGAITHSPGFRPMPDIGPQLDSCSISKVKAWIDAGKPE